MKEFILCEENLIWNFLEELRISHYSIFEQELKKQFPEWSDQKIEEVSDLQSDAINEEISDSGLLWDIKGEAYDEFEQEEATGLWGYYKFEIYNVEETKSLYEKKIEEIMRELILRLSKKRKLV